MRKTTIVIAALFLAGASGAQAKQIHGAQMCGADACRSVPSGALTHALLGGPTPIDPPARGAFYRVRVGIGDGKKVFDHVEVDYLPRARATSAAPPDQRRWTRLDARSARVLRKATAGLEPLPASELAAVHPKPPDVIVDEVIRAPAEAAEDDDGGAPAAAGGGALALAAIGAGALVLRRRRR